MSTLPNILIRIVTPFIWTIPITSHLSHRQSMAHKAWNILGFIGNALIEKHFLICDITDWKKVGKSNICLGAWRYSTRTVQSDPVSILSLSSLCCQDADQFYKYDYFLLSHQKLSFCKLHLSSIPLWRYLGWDSLEKLLQLVVRAYADPHLQLLRQTAASPSELTYRLNHSKTQAQKEVWEEQSQRWWPMSQLTRRSHFSKKILLSIPETTLSWPLLSK